MGSGAECSGVTMWRHDVEAEVETKALDGDGDGKVSLAEFVAAGGTAEQFAALDTDGSGYIDEAELMAVSCCQRWRHRSVRPSWVAAFMESRWAFSSSAEVRVSTHASYESLHTYLT